MAKEIYNTIEDTDARACAVDYHLCNILFDLNMKNGASNNWQIDLERFGDRISDCLDVVEENLFFVDKFSR